MAEPSGAVPVAGLFKLKNETLIKMNNLKVGAIITGGNIDLNDFFSALEKKVGSTDGIKMSR